MISASSVRILRCERRDVNQAASEDAALNNE